MTELIPPVPILHSLIFLNKSQIKFTYIFHCTVCVALSAFQFQVSYG
jgi:hypothetical protein